MFRIPETFLLNVELGIEDVSASFAAPTPSSIRTVSEILQYGDRVTAQLKSWWDELDDKTCQWAVKLNYGIQPACQFLERSTWHSAQHTRQLEAALDGLGVALAYRINDEKYAGLPMPKGLWE